MLGTSLQCSVSLLGLGAWEKLVLLWLQLSGGKLSPFPENPNYVFTEASGPGLDRGWVRVESMENVLWAPMPGHCLEPTGFGSRHELYSLKLSRRVL